MKPEIYVFYDYLRELGITAEDLNIIVETTSNDCFLNLHVWFCNRLAQLTLEFFEHDKAST